MNTIALLATLDSEPELRTSQDGLSNLSAILRFAAEQADEADYKIRVILFGKTAEQTNGTLHLGDVVTIDGRIQTETRTKPDGSKYKVTELVARRIERVPTPVLIPNLPPVSPEQRSANTTKEPGKSRKKPQTQPVAANNIQEGNE